MKTVFFVYFTLVFLVPLCGFGEETATSTQLYEQWLMEGDKFDIDLWINKHDPLTSIHSLSNVLLKDLFPVRDVQRCVIDILRLSKKVRPDMCSDDIYHIIKSERIGIIQDDRICSELTLSDSRLANEESKGYLLSLFNKDQNNYNVIRLIGWSRLVGVTEKLKKLFEERKVLWKSGDDWRSDKLLLWCTLALIRYDDQDALSFWIDRTNELSKSMLSYHGNVLPSYYYGSTTGMDIAYIRTRNVIKIGADAIWNSKIRRPGDVFAPLSEVVAGFGTEKTLVEESPSEKTYNEFINWLLDKDRKYAE